MSLINFKIWKPKLESKDTSLKPNLMVSQDTIKKSRLKQQYEN